MLDNKKNILKKQIKIKGIPAAPGIAIGKVHIFGAEDISPEKRNISTKEISGEISRFKEALKETRKEILAIERKISKEMGVEHEKFLVHIFSSLKIAF